MRRLWLASVVLSLACTGEGRSEARALEHYQAGRALLDRGEHRAAAQRFEQALEAEPRQPLLRSWAAYALASGGDLRGAIELLEGQGVVGISPHDRYNLAAWHARLGERESALALLAAALEDEPELRAFAAEDPDFEELRADGTLSAGLEDRALRAVMLGEEGAILAGELYDLELDVQPASVQLRLEWQRELPSSMRLVRVVDTRSGAADEPGLRTLQYRLRTHEGGEGSLGPWKVHAQGQSVEVPPQGWEAVLPAGVRLDPPASSFALEPVWWTPREALQGFEAGQAEYRHGCLVVGWLPGDRVLLEGAEPSAEPMEIELRDNDQASLLARAWPLAPDERRFSVVITRQGGRILEATLQRPAD